MCSQKERVDVVCYDWLPERRAEHKSLQLKEPQQETPTPTSILRDACTYA